MSNLPLLRPEHIDGYLQVTDTDAIHVARRLAREKGILAHTLCFFMHLSQLRLLPDLSRAEPQVLDEVSYASV